MPGARGKRLGAPPTGGEILKTHIATVKATHCIPAYHTPTARSRRRGERGSTFGVFLLASRLESNQEGLRGWVFPGGTIPRVSVAKALDSAPGGSSQHQDGHPPPALRSGGRYPRSPRTTSPDRSLFIATRISVVTTSLFSPFVSPSTPPRYP